MVGSMVGLQVVGIMAMGTASGISLASLVLALDTASVTLITRSTTDGFSI